ncbi:MAG TPA: histidine phosphatase family protein [Rhizomicrobium sp.]|jgi:broad specificity phosphatase PhoE|nr:histidine phosphatase family protein [Rhizomicrobium sp.]
MTRIYMVRHGRAAAGFGESMDPGLDELGRSQAEAVAEKLKALGPLPILSSPLARTQQTAVPLAKLWNATTGIEPAVAEIPSPKGMTLEGRVAWLRKLMAGSWRDASPELAAWREHCIGAVTGITQDTVIFSHYVAINVIAGAALGDDRVVVFSPDNCSVTVFETDGETLRLIEKGHEASLTKVN